MNPTASERGNAIVETYHGDLTQRFYMLDKKVKDPKIKADEDLDILFWKRLLTIIAHTDKVG